MQIHVTAYDIMDGIRGDGRSCPIARAIVRELEEEVLILIGESSMYIRRVKYKLPDVCKDFIQRFDNGLSVNPFVFDFDI